MKKPFAVILMTGVMVAGMFTPLKAVDFSIDGLDADWANAVGGSNVSYNNDIGSGGRTSIVSWGGFFDQSSYTFETTPTSFTVSEGTPFIIGEFTHSNFAIPSGTSITQVELDMSMESIGVFDLEGTFTYSHNETSNAPGPPASNDIVTILNPGAQTKTIQYQGYWYDVSLLGFSQDGGQTFDSQYITMEGQDNNSFLYAQITAVPEPSTYALLGIGAILGAAVLRKKKSSAAAAV